MADRGPTLKRRKLNNPSSNYEMDQNEQLLTILPKRGQEGLKRMETRVESTGPRIITNTYGNANGNQTITFVLPAGRNQYIDLGNLTLNFIQVGLALQAPIPDPAVGMHGAIQSLTISTGSGEIMERYMHYPERVAAKTKWMNHNAIDNMTAAADMLTTSPSRPNTSPLYPGFINEDANHRVYESRNPLVGIVNSAGEYDYPYSLKFLGSDLCSQMDSLLPLHAFGGLQIEIEFNTPKKYLKTVMTNPDGVGEYPHMIPIADAAEIIMKDIHLNVEYWELSKEMDDQIHSFLQGNTIPIHYLSSRVIRGYESFVQNELVERSIPITEKLSSVRAVHLAFINQRSRVSDRLSSYYFSEPGSAQHIDYAAVDQDVLSFKSFQVEYANQQYPEHAITSRTRLLQHVEKAALENNRNTALNNRVSPTAFHMSQSVIAGAFSGAVPDPANIAALEGAIGANTNALARLAFSNGGGFVCAYNFRTYASFPNVLNGVPFKDDCTLRYSFHHGGNAGLNFDRYIFITHDTLLEIGGGDSKMVVKT